MRGIYRVTVGLAVALTAMGMGAAIPAGAVPGASFQRIAADEPILEIAVPAGNRQIALMPAVGVQIYQCTNRAWTFLQPDATLEHRGQEVRHTKGPTWTSVTDGSSVTAAVRDSMPRADTIAWLLLKSTGNRGPGLLGEVTYIQRLNTTGGLAPAGSCTDGVTEAVPYTADYTFWVASQE